MIPDNLVIPAAVAAFALLVWAVLRLVRLTRSGDFDRGARLAGACAALWGLGLLLVTLGGRPQDTSGLVFFNWVPFATQTAANDTEIVMNVLLFVPAGLLLPWIARNATRRRVIGLAAAGAALLSTTIELLQTFTTLGTAGDITDILSNTAGSTIAAVISSSAHHWLTTHQFTKTDDEAKQLQ